MDAAVKAWCCCEGLVLRCTLCSDALSWLCMLQSVAEKGLKGFCNV